MRGGHDNAWKIGAGAGKARLPHECDRLSRVIRSFPVGICKTGYRTFCYILQPGLTFHYLVPLRLQLKQREGGMVDAVGAYFYQVFFGKCGGLLERKQTMAGQAIVLPTCPPPKFDNNPSLLLI